MIPYLFIMKIHVPVFGLIICIESKAAKNRNQVQLATRVLWGLMGSCARRKDAGVFPVANEKTWEQLTRSIFGMLTNVFSK